MGENPSPSETPQPTGIPRHAFLGVSITFLLLTAAFVAARLSVNIRNNKKIHFDDYIAAVAIVLFSATFGLDDELVKSFEKPTTTISELLKYGVAVDVLSGLSLATSKIPILFLYIRLFGVKRWLKILSYVLLFVLVVLIVVSIVAIAVVCAPHAEIEPQSHLLKCNNWSAHNGIATGIFSLVLDIIIFLLPIPIIINLRLPTSRKIGLAVVFASGLFAIGASAVSLRFKLNSLSGTSTDTSTAIFFTNLEWCIAVMVGCVPALYSFWSSFIANSTLYSRISTILSTLSLPLSTTRSNRTYGSNKSKPSNISQAAPRGVPSTSTENIVLVAESEDNVSLRKQLSNQHQGGVFEYPLHNLSKQNP